MIFTKRKFQSLTNERQHKKCSELLKSLYEDLLNQKPIENLFQHYLELRSWMVPEEIEVASKLEPKELNLKQLADHYHYHLRLANKQNREHNLLSSIRKCDREDGEPIGTFDVYLDQLRSAHNVGSIIRTVEAFAFGSIYFSQQTPFTDNKQVQDASMGTAQWVNCSRDKSLHELRKPVIALETSNHAISLYDFIFPEAFTLVVGNEEYGCSDETLKIADFILEIPLRGRKNSLNVANAFAITVSEIQRQKKE